jgi:O-antigen/teichoic acid export membrane protein
VLRDCVAVLSSSHVASVCGIATSVAMRAALGPALMGIWAALRSILEYASYSGLGSNRAANVGIAVAVGRGDRDGDARLANAGMTMEMLAAAPVAVALLASSIYCGLAGRSAWAFGCAGAAILALVSRYQAFCLTVLRARLQFVVTAQARVLGAVTEIGLMAGGAWLCGIAGLVLGASISQVINIWFLCRRGPLHWRWLWDRELAGELVGTGWPIAASALALAATRSVDRLMIVALLPNGEYQLGLYSAALLLSAWAYDQANLISNVIFPRLGTALGQTGDPAAVFQLALRTAERLAWLMALCAMAVLLVGMPLTARLLPAFRDGLPAAYGAVAAASVLGVSIPLRHAVVTVGRGFQLLAINAAAAATATLGCWIAVRTGGALSSVAWASTAAASLCLMLLLVAVTRGVPASLRLLRNGPDDWASTSSPRTAYGSGGHGTKAAIQAAAAVLMATAYLVGVIVLLALPGHSVVSRCFVGVTAALPVAGWALTEWLARPHVEPQPAGDEAGDGEPMPQADAA